MHSSLVCTIVVLNNFAKLTSTVDKSLVIEILFTDLCLDRWKQIDWAQVRSVRLVDFSQSANADRVACCWSTGD